MTAEQKRERLRSFEAACRARGVALTVQRRRILELILDRTDHPTADQVYDATRPHLPGVSRTTVYRVLEMLVEAGAITKASTPGSATRFDPKIKRHHHLVCLHCDQLIDLEDERLDAAVVQPPVQHRSFRIKDFSVHFYGTCAACQRKQRSRGPALARTRGRTTRSKTARKRKGTSEILKRRKTR